MQQQQDNRHKLAIEKRQKTEAKIQSAKAQAEKHLKD